MFYIGDTVRFKDEIGEGVVTAVHSQKHVTVLTTEGFENKYLLTSLVLVKRADVEEFVNVEKNTKVEHTEIFSEVKLKKEKKYILKKFLKQTKLAGKKKGELFAEIDLHLEELVEYQTKLMPHEKLQHQINHFKKCLNEAKELKIRKLIFIHGVGQGVLKTELRKMLDEQTGIEYKNASFKEYGMGATEVLILGLYK
jgi:hypothetical protein